MEEIKILNDIISTLKNRDLSMITSDNRLIINSITMRLLNNKEYSQQDIMKMGNIIGISNILYNNTDIDLLPLEDGIYDLILEEYKIINPTYQVGAEPILFDATKNINSSSKGINPVSFADPQKTDDFLFLDDIKRNPILNKKDFMHSPVSFGQASISKRTTNTKHNYPKLVGTLDKCKFVLNSQATEKGVFNDNNVKVFERDFIQKHIESGILNPDRKFSLVLELKYDGISVEADIGQEVDSYSTFYNETTAKANCDEVLSARSRGDAGENIAADLTPILKGYKFRHASLDHPVMGIKFEAIMTYDNLYKYNTLKGKEYKNCRTAISGLFASSDAANYREFITLVPLATSIESIDRLTEIEFMNNFYHSGEQLRYTVITGNYVEILFQVKRFVEEAEYMRSFLPFMYDGVVVSYIEEDFINALGRTNAVNKYSMAIKFNPLKKQTIFRGYKFTVGQDGSVTPMIHYDPVEFYGTIHDKSTGHSFYRFNTLALRIGDILDVEYVNDVMPYVTKPDNSHNSENTNPLEPFLTQCPSCGSKLKVSKSQKSIACENMECPDRNISRLVNMMQKLNLKDFAEELLLRIAKTNLSDMLSLTLEDVSVLGEANSKKFMERMDELKTIPVMDYNIIGSLGFTNVGRKKWKLILNKYSLYEIIDMDEDVLKNLVVTIKGVGPITAETIAREFDFFRNDLNIINSMRNVMNTKGVKSGKSIRFTGFRDSELVDILIGMGLDADDNASVTKTTDILLIPFAGFSEGNKLKKVGPDTQIVPVQEFKDNMERYV